VHRLDKETSGVLLLAKKRSALTALQDQFRARDTGKTYAALVGRLAGEAEGHRPAAAQDAGRRRRAPRARGRRRRTRRPPLDHAGAVAQAGAAAARCWT
jgi:23S rRNA-/tRNA-specific pseudouridylate synthase